ncbi:MAG: hypothetical protein M3336_07785 [Chloroflexota bacterium]|nr:hypothetical protein [Chloroflexota bacterium]
MARSVRWLDLVRVLAPMMALALDGPGAGIGALIIQESALWLAARLARPPTLFLAAYGIRVAAMGPTHYLARLSDGNGALFQDDYTTDLVAEWLVRIARGEGISVFPGHQHLLDSSFTYLLMALYAVFGHAPVLPKLLNCALAALAAVLIFAIARRAFGARVAAWTAIGAAAMPTLILWSIVTLKETLVLLVTVAGLWALQLLSEKGAVSATRSADLLVLVLAVTLVCLDLRSTTAALLLLLLGVVLLARMQVRPGAWRASLAGLTLLAVVAGGLFFARGHMSNRPPGGVVDDIVLQIRHRRAQESASARTQIRPQVEVLSPQGTELPLVEAASDAAPFSFTADVLDPLGYALLAPAPWQARDLTELAISAEMLVWYVLLAGALFAWRAAPQQRLFLVCLAAYGVGQWLVLAASEGNLGNLLRHRLMLAPTLLVLGPAGLDWLWQRAGRPGVARWLSPAVGAGARARS